LFITHNKGRYAVKKAIVFFLSLFLVVPVVFAQGGGGGGGALAVKEAIGFKFEKRIVLAGTLIPISLYMSTAGIQAVDMTINIPRSLEVRYGNSPFFWQYYNQPQPLVGSYFNENTREMRIAIASSAKISLPALSKIGIFYVKVPSDAQLGAKFSIKVSSARFNGVITPACGSLELEIGPKVMLGNPTGSGTRSSLDALDCLLLSLQPDSVKYSISVQRFLAADVDGDYNLTETDAYNILRKVVNPDGYYFPIEDVYPTLGSGSGGEKGSIEVPFEPVLGGYTVSLNSSAASGRFDITLPPGVTFEPTGLSRVMTAQRYDEGTGVLSVAFAGDVPNGQLFALRGANASNTKITGRLDGVAADIRKVEKVTDVENASPPKNFILGQNYPNPFNPSTKISFAMPKAGNAVLRVFDMQGREVATLVNGEMSIGNHEVTFDASRLTSGTYIYRLQAGEFTETKKMILLK